MLQLLIDKLLADLAELDSLPPRQQYASARYMVDWLDEQVAILVIHPDRWRQPLAEVTNLDDGDLVELVRTHGRPDPAAAFVLAAQTISCLIRSNLASGGP